MTNLRMIGLFLGLAGLVLSFLIYRGVRWKKANFVLFSSINVFLIVLCINPNAANILRDMLSLQEAQYGRILALIITASFFSVFFAFYIKAKLEVMRLQFDKLIRRLGAMEVAAQPDFRENLKPIMVIIPAYNEEGNLDELLSRLPKNIGDSEVGCLIIDDGSTDGTAEVAKKHGCLVLSNIINRGQGGACRLGYDVLINGKVPIGVTMDADNQHQPEDIEKLVAPIAADQLDLVIGSRILGQQEKGSFSRNIGIRLLSGLLSLMLGIKITDCSSGFKAFNIKKINKIKLMEDQFQAAEVLIESVKKGLRVGEVPILIKQRKHGESKKGRDLNYGFYFTKTIFKAWWR